MKTVGTSDLKVLHGTIEIANQMNTMATGLNELGVYTKSLNYYPSYLGYKSDVVLPINSFENLNVANMKTKELAKECISHFDVFHFHFATSLTLDYSDLLELKKLEKKVIMHHWGSDVRVNSKAIQLNPYVKVKVMDEDYIKKKLTLLSKYISHCIVADYELYEYVKDYYENVYLIRQAINLQKYIPSTENYKNKKLLIVHAPSSPKFKGTEFILKAIEELKPTFDFDFQLIQGMSHEQAKEIYKKADLIIDQILIGGYGLFAIESMAMGKPVICWISDFMKEKYPKELPIISANHNNIKEKIENLLKNKDMLGEIGKNGREYVEKYHDMHKISKQLLQLYKTIK